ncbi:MAG: MGMT family protein [Methanoregula sp.]|jgi:methylated-DNA-[protein]-cysteine S-methyltransferase
MEVTGGSCRFGLWHVHVWSDGTTVHRVRFAPTGIFGPVPAHILKYCSGQVINLSVLPTIACEGDHVAAQIYRAVQQIPYGSTATYGEIAGIVGTSPRVVGRAMAHNPTPLIVPCHRVVAKDGMGGFTPALEIKEQLLAMERKGLKKRMK